MKKPTPSKSVQVLRPFNLGKNQCSLTASPRLGEGQVHSPVPVHRIIIAPALDSNGNQRANNRGALYSASYLGDTIVTSSSQPLLDASRILHARGLSGELQMWDCDSPYPRFRTSIAKAAKLTIEEGDRLPRFVKFKSFNGRDALQAFSGAGGTPTAPDTEDGFTEHPPASPRDAARVRNRAASHE